MRRNINASWALLYILTLFICGLLLGVYRMPLPEGWQKVCAIALLLAYYGLVAGWLRRNRDVLARKEQEQQRQRSSSRGRDVPVTPVQTHFLRVMEQHQRSGNG